MKNTYSLDESIKSLITIINKSNTEGIYIESPSSNWATFSVSDESNNSLPVFHIPEEPVFMSCTLKVGESISQKLYWSQLIWYDSQEGFNIYSGNYLYKAYFRGPYSLSQNVLTKWITITEEGDHNSELILNRRRKYLSLSSLCGAYTGIFRLYIECFY